MFNTGHCPYIVYVDEGFCFFLIAYVVSTYDGPAVKLRRGVINFVTLTRLSPLSWWSGFKLSVKSNQAISLALVLVLPRFEVG